MTDIQLQDISSSLRTFIINDTEPKSYSTAIKPLSAYQDYKQYDYQQTQESSIQEDISEFPDGGFEAYTSLFGTFCGLVPVFGVFNSLGAIQSYISNQQLAGVKASNISWIFSSYLTICFASSVLVGAYFDRNGGRIPGILVTILFVGGIMAMANSTKIWHFILSFGVCCGVATGFMATISMSSVTTWFYKKRSTATSIALLGGSIGGIIFPIMLRKLFVELGFEWAIRILGFISLGCLLCYMCLSKERPIDNKDARHLKKPFESRRQCVRWYITSCFNWRYLLDYKFLFTSLGVSLAESSLTAASTYFASYAIFKGNSEETSYVLLTMINVFSIVGRVLPGYLSDHFFGGFNVIIVMVIMCTVFNFAIWLPFGGNSKCLWAYSCLYGVSSGGIMSLTPPLIGKISKTVDFGKRYSTTYLIQAVLTLPIIPICGAIIGNDPSLSDYNNFIIFATMLMLGGAFCYIIARYLCVGFKLVAF
ncbi:related to Probable transporter MCH4 [Saccharomycodes ludwigii]|uniref:Related to Probable transporter MCH4 n=1 Tax=Saccharomycodes ludwigii TaxID=36035 RepID=A0A376B8X9_9ASCO|nr:hypothetical protein SCDLUD_005329 [Saccharomycodes ludwigii]XP_045934719.1 hypothetical protein SCDLUD_003792 [Saccharomycodes ludwigii]KAH3898982.1 hypothetical protein SCDLUD_005329 [Saccharomycodes ludwigii]KAH3900786.1 hypothetical protein SCDLUD_003792 [Saccharomycodes ludwigii]SSD61153.1 related to Probable transporter MCH4 [Saccharomycodes ludwigii]